MAAISAGSNALGVALRDALDRSGQGNRVPSQAVGAGYGLRDHQALTFGSGRDGVPVPHQKGEGAMAVGASEAENNRLRQQAARVTRLLVTRLLVRTSTCMACGGHLSRCDDTPDQFTREAARQNSDSSITGRESLAAHLSVRTRDAARTEPQDVGSTRRTGDVSVSRQMFDESADPSALAGRLRAERAERHMAFVLHGRSSG